MGEYNKEKKAFAKRSQGTTKPFADINREALAYVLDTVSQKYGKQHLDLLSLNPTEKAEFEKLLQQENFPKLYAWALEKTTIAPAESLENTKGKWIRYPQNSNHLPLVESLRGHGTGWCTAGEGVAQTQLNSGDFYVYYTLDKQGKPTIPRAAIRMQGDRIAEVRGIAQQQNLDPYIAPIVQTKMKEFPDGTAYEKKAQDMKYLTVIEKKTKNNQSLTKDELTFLYELNSPIQGFGYGKDPRIQELRQQRNPEADMLIIFDCTKDQIAHTKDQINKSTKAYVGPWNIDSYYAVKSHPNIQHRYESFPDKKIFMMTLETDPAINSPEKAEKVLKDKNTYVSDWGHDLILKTEFSQEPQHYELVQFTVAQLGFPQGATTEEIYERAKQLGLELCPAEVGPHLRLQYSGTDWKAIAMKQISDRDGDPRVFYLDAGGAGLNLLGAYAHPDDGWDSGSGFIFLSRK